MQDKVLSAVRESVLNSSFMHKMKPEFWCVPTTTRILVVP